MDLRDDDLFSVAGSLAELLGAPVTIEDENSTVLAYSGGEQAVDEARIGTILGRQVPGRIRELLSNAGVFERLHRETDPIYVNLDDPAITPRLVIAVRENNIAVGSIWVALAGEPTPSQESTLRAAVPVVAEHIASERDRINSTRRRQTERVKALIGGGEQAFRAAEDLRLRGPLTVVAVGATAGFMPSTVAASLGLYLDTLAVDAVIAQLIDATYLVVSADEANTRRLLEDFLGRARERAQLAVAVGRTVKSASECHLSRADADHVLGALRHNRSGGIVAGMNDTLASVLALHVADIFDGLGDATPLGALDEHDRRHGSELVATARAFLDKGGDVANSSAALHVHPNTLRNRLRRCKDMCGVDLTDADTRLILMLQFKLRN
ncbi:UNVERIFIED_ORG: DNA-binding PucR family transcriptional regulator [Nocardia globerula]|uniref:DNA-binding PucR family transcriptional regulator n=1 Tax=Nocardia globerula TaxID=1818 RepID=A0A652YW45_NOCGL|nr:PucR family transcriptional regulator [Rhodococcus globerulus]NMD59709.1 PucR family transcriptional regulator [Nocardia globerula]PVX64205.1 DNA-binding PucR family transcriptional regulator [Rhodococcus globerulus]